ncbi:phage/plasmid primase, P4 family [Desulfuromonas thiophila]|uniref:phage/plasmid primase, P4 family n=1 Tax=Desulfuromonas thiophila TaxID=57664 RepID=UPI0029F4D95F|nr:phage/plasmid primase, P4 family [Desulfuromonas thiophila]
MGLAVECLSEQQRAEIARDLFVVKSSHGGELHGLCRFHDDTNASFSYNFQKDAFNCLACGAKGDLVALWCHVAGFDPRVDGVRRFKAAFGLDAAAGAPWEGERQMRPPVRRVVEDSSDERIIDESVIVAMPRLDPLWVDRLERERGWSRAVIEALELRQFGEREPRIAIPVRNVQGDLVNIRLYRPGAAQNKVISYSEKRGEKKVSFGSARLFPSPAQWGLGRVWLCEGEPDVIRALSAGLNAVTQTAGANSFKKEFLQEFKNREVVIAYDADKPGIEGAHKLAERLRDHAKLVRVLEWPACMAAEDGSWPENHGQDLTDFFQRHGKTVADLENLLPQAAVYEREPEPEMAGGVRRFFNGRKFRPKLLADAIMEDLSVLADPQTGLLYRWTGKYFQPWHFERLEAYALRMLLDEGEPARATAAARIVFLESLLPEDQAMDDVEDLICLENGMVGVGPENFGRLLAHDRKYRSSQMLPYSFNPRAECPRWMRFLEEVVPAPAVRAQIQEFFGYCLTRETRYAKALLLKGPGSDGKSIILQVLQRIVGLENCSAVQMGRLDDPFERATLYRKLLNVAAEENKKAFDSSWFKAIASGDRISASFKHKDFFEFLPYCKLAFATNFWPAASDNTHGYYRRLLPVEFEKQFGPEFGNEANPHLIEDLLEEVEGIFLWALAGLEALRAQDGFTRAERTEEILRKYKQHNNPLLTFIDEYCVIEDGARVAVDHLFKRYVDVVTAWKNFPLNRQNFGVGVRAEVRTLKEGRMPAADVDYPRARAYVGIRLRQPGEQPPAPPTDRALLNGMDGICPGCPAVSGRGGSEADR